MDITIPELLKKLQATDSLTKRMGIMQKNKVSDDDICGACKNAYKYEELGMCVMIEWCRWDLDFPLFKTERQEKNSRDCSNFLTDDCWKYTDTLEKGNHEKCKDCPYFNKREQGK